MKKNIGITLSLATVVGISVIAQSNVDFAQLSEQSATKVIESLGNIKSNQIVGNIITDYSNYKKEKEASSKEDYKDYKDDALYIADLKTDKAVVERIEKEMEKETQEEETASSDSSSIHGVGEIPGPRNEEKKENLISQNISEIPTSSHFSIPETAEKIQPAADIKETPVEVVNITASKDSDEKETSKLSSTSVKESEIEVSAKKEQESSKEKSDNKAIVEKNEKDSQKRTEESAKETNQTDESFEKYIIVSDVYFRDDKSNESQILGTLKKDTILEGKTDPYWIEIKQGDQTGYVSAKYVKKIDKALLDETVQASAASLKQKTAKEDSIKLSGKEDLTDKDEAGLENTESINTVEQSENTNSKEDKEIVQYIVARDVNFRDDKSNDSNILGTLEKDTILEGKPDPYWIEINKDGKKAFVSAKFLKKTDGSQTNESKKTSQSKAEESDSIQKHSKESLSKEKESIGNTSSKMQGLVGEAIDLAAGKEQFSKEKIADSNFIKYLYKSHLDIELSSNIKTLLQNGYKVSRDNLKAGDLVFFSNEKNNIDKAGIYIGGNRFIHASKSNGEFINSNIKSDEYNKTFVTARRIMN